MKQNDRIKSYQIVRFRLVRYQFLQIPKQLVRNEIKNALKHSKEKCIFMNGIDQNVSCKPTQVTLYTTGHLLPVSANREVLKSSNSKQACRKETLWLLNRKALVFYILQVRRSQSKLGLMKGKIHSAYCPFLALCLHRRSDF